MLRIRTLLASVFNYRPGEGRLLGLLLVLFFFKGTADVFFATSASTLYLQAFGTRSLPYVYLASALVVTVMGLAYSRLTIRVSTSRLLKLTLVVVVASIAAFHVLLLVATSRWWTMGLMVWREVLYMLLNATFWAQVGLLLNVRQGKRLFPVIAGGDIVSAAIGGAAIPFIVTRIGTLHLLFFAELAIALCVVVSAAIDRVAPSPAVQSDDEVEPDTRSLATLVRERYLALFFGVSIFSYLIYFFADYNFYDVVNRRYPDAATLASFFGIFYAVLNAVSLLLNGVVAGRLLTRYGIAVGLLAVPLLVGVGTIGAVGLALLGLAPVMFWAIIGTKLVDEMLRGAFLYPTYKILYQPLPVRERVRVQAVRDSIVEPVAVGLSGILLLALTRFLGFGIVQLAWVLLAVLAVFTVIAVALRHEYVAVLGKALSRRRRMDDSSMLANASSLAVLRRGVRSAMPTEAIYCLGLLEEADPAVAIGDLLDALSHADADVRSYAMRRLREATSREAASTASDQVAALVERERSPAVLGEALWTLGDLSRGEANARIAGFLDYPDATVRWGAMVGLLRHGGTPGERAARRILDAWLDSPDAEHRAAGARVIGDAGSASLAALLVPLLVDPNPRVVSAALGAAGKVKDPTLLADVAKQLDDADLRAPAAAAIVQFGEIGVPLLASALDRATRASDAVRVVRILGRTGTVGAIDVLVRHLEHEDENIRGVVLQTLSRARFVAGGATVALVRDALRHELENAAWLLASRQDVDAPGNPNASVLTRALENDVRESTDRVLLLLSFLYPRQTVLNARTLLLHGSEDQRAQALEAVDNLLPRALSDAVLPLLDELTLVERVTRIGKVFAQRSRRAVDRLVEVVSAPPYALSYWSRACAIYVGAATGAAPLEAPVREASRHPNPFVRETAQGVLGRFRGSERGRS